jgi:N-acetylglucosaminyldiphosphoundecaprenol N-acetyl-beta-D-mannosaminyltransferase
MMEVPVSLMNLESMVSGALHAIEGASAPYTVAFANPHSLVVSRQDKVFREALGNMSVVAPDGTGIVIASKLRGGRITTRITGSDFFAALSQELNGIGGKRFYFLGASQGTLDELRSRFEKRFPSIIFAGAYAPPFRESFSAEETAEMISLVNAAKADVLWVGMTAPKQEKWVHQNAASLNVRVIGAIGAVFDYFAGRVQRPGKLWRACGLEWLPRLLQEPRRLWRRNFVSTPLFLYMVVRERFGKKR